MSEMPDWLAILLSGIIVLLFFAALDVPHELATIARELKRMNDREERRQP